MNKKLFSVLVFSVLFTLGTQAQTDFKKVVLGFHGQMGFSFFSPDAKNYESDGAIFSKGFGLRVDYNFAKNYSISSGFNVDYSGGKLSYPHLKDVNGIPTIGTLYRKYQLQYLELPINLVLKTNQIGYFTYYLQTGINTSIRMKARYFDDFEYKDASGNTQNNVEDDVDANDFIKFGKIGYMVGIGTEYALGESFSVYGMVFYDNSLFNVLKAENKIDPSIDEYAKVSNIGIRIGILF